MDKKIDGYAKVFRDALEDKGLTNPDSKVAAFKRRLGEMYASEAFEQHNVYPTTNVTLIYAVIAMCLDLREYGLADDEIITLVNGAFKKRKAVVNVLAKLINQLPNSYKIAERWNIADHEKRVKDGSITYDYFTVADGRIEYRISHCIYVEMFEHYGIRRLCKIFCMTDVDAYAKIPKHIEFVRHSDLADGDCCHDEIYDRKHRQGITDSNR